MIKTNTVFILGAGSSAPYGYPTGESLIQKMISEVSNPMLLSSYGEQKSLSAAQIRTLIATGGEFKKALENSQPRSIDSFLEKRSEFLELGKFIIAYIIASEESNHELVIRTSLNKSTHWMKYLKDLMFDRPYKEILKNKVTFITFNYDMLLEKYLLNVLKATYKIDEPSDFFNSVQILHIHGRIKRFPWEHDDLVDLSWGTPNDPKSVIQMAGGIKLVHEKTQLDATLNDAQNRIANSTKIFFLGFGFHRENISKLGSEYFSQGTDYSQPIYATALGKTPEEINRIKMELGLRNDAESHDIDCYGLLRMKADRLF